MAKVTLVLGEETLENNIALAIEHQNDADLFEVRADFLRQEELANLPSLALKLPKPAILTFRLPKDGGVWRSSEKQRQQAFLLALEGSWYAIDIEEFIEAPTIIQKAREKGIKIVRSFHNFEGIPKDTGKRMKDIAESGFIPKAAVTCRNSQDFARWVRIAEEIQELKVKVLLGMGDFGLPTRLLAGLWGMSWTYGSSEGQTMAPGQITVSAMTQIFRVQAVNSKTTVYGIIGNPVLHSKSPHFHNMALAHLGLDALYLPFPVSDPKNFWPLLGALNIKGLSVTIPWKGDAALWAQGQTPRVQKIGACNTLYIQKNRWMGDNTDAPGFFEPIAERLGPESLAGKKACVIGNGGASKAAIYALLEAGVEVLVLGKKS
jgi:3-dehydroquinate dehydratase/shikimate dehydrogenase